MIDEIELAENEYLAVSYVEADNELLVKLTVLEPEHLVRNHRGMVPMERMVYRALAYIRVDRMGSARESQLDAIRDAVFFLRDKASREGHGYCPEPPNEGRRDPGHDVGLARADFGRRLG